MCHHFSHDKYTCVSTILALTALRDSQHFLTFLDQHLLLIARYFSAGFSIFGHIDISYHISNISWQCLTKTWADINDLFRLVGQGPYQFSTHYHYSTYLHIFQCRSTQLDSLSDNRHITLLWTSRYLQELSVLRYTSVEAIIPASGDWLEFEIQQRTLILMTGQGGWWTDVNPVTF